MSTLARLREREKRTWGCGRRLAAPTNYCGIDCAIERSSNSKGKPSKGSCHHLPQSCEPLLIWWNHIATPVPPTPEGKIASNSSPAANDEVHQSHSLLLGKTFRLLLCSAARVPLDVNDRGQDACSL